FMTGALTATMGAPETSDFLRTLLGRPPQDAEIGELVQPLLSDWVRERVLQAARAIGPLGLLNGDPWTGVVPPDSGPPSTWIGRVKNDAQAFADLMSLLARDAARLAIRFPTYDPRASGYVKNILKA